MVSLNQQETQQANLILVVGFDETLWTRLQLVNFTQTSIDYAKILPKIIQAVVISALNISIVQHTYSETLARHLRCKFILMPEGKPFIDQDEIYPLPVV